ncbi:MAG: FHA domain-containing protein, partial [Cytophagaceae bacterium]|nr:FHA domain-containing protein [Cytophagaceae bacterium]
MQLLTIGRNPDNRLVLNDPNQRVSNFHAEIKLYDDGRITLLDKSFNGTSINGRPVPKNTEVPLHRGDAVLFADLAPLDWNRVPSVTASTDLKHSFSIGRNADNTIPIPHDQVSRYHAVLRINEQGKIHLQDQSHNGTFVNGVRISPYTQYPIKRGDAVSFANVASLDWNLIPQPSSFSLPGFDFSRFDRRIYYGVAALALLLLAWVAFRPNLPPSERYRHSVGMIAMRFYVVYNNASKPVLYFGPDGGTTYQSTASALNIEPFEGTGSGFFVGDEGLVVTNRHVATPWESTGSLLNELFNVALTNQKGQRRPLSEQEYQYYNLQSRIGWSYKLYVSVWVVFMKDAYNGLKPNFKGGRHARLGIVLNEASVNVKDYMDVALPCQLLKTAPDINVD